MNTLESLRERFGIRFRDGEQYYPPRTEQERELIKIYEEFHDIEMRIRLLEQKVTLIDRAS